MSARKHARLVMRWSDYAALCPTPGCGKSWKGKRAHIAARQHAEKTGHHVSLQTATTQLVGESWVPVLDGIRRMQREREG